MPGKPAHKYFSFQALTQAYFNHSVPIFIFSPVQSPREGPVVHSVALSWGDVPILLLLVIFMDCFHFQVLLLPFE